jgi:putrescine transport system substrate-binding protein
MQTLNQPMRKLALGRLRGFDGRTAPQMGLLGALLASIAPVLLILGCSAGSQQTVGSAAGAPQGDEERVLNVYNWFDYIDRSVIPDFEKEYGVHVNYDVFDADEVLDTKVLTGHSGYDVVAPSALFFEQELAAGAFLKLDKTRLPNLRNVDPEVRRFQEGYDPGTQFGVVYTWLNITGVAFDAAKVRSRLADAPLDSWRMVFDPAIVSRFEDCGVIFIDAPRDVVAAALIYLGKDPESEDPQDLQAAETTLMRVRKYLRYVDTSRYISDLANGDICMALGWSGDLIQARDRAKEAQNPLPLTFSIPKEGSLNGADIMAIPVDAPHPLNAHLFLNYLLRPEVAARITNAVSYANGVSAATALLRPQLRADPVVYPPPEVRAKLHPEHTRSPDYTRRLMRMWTRFKTHT